ATAWQLLDEEGQKQGISRSEIIEQVARSFAQDKQQTVPNKNEKFLEVVAEKETTCQELTLQEAESKVAAVLESISDAFVAFDLDWRYTYVNQAATQLLKKTPQELIGKHVWNEVFPSEVGGVAYQELHRAMTQQMPVSWEEFGQSIGRWLEVRAYPSLDGIALYFQDVTERKQNEEALRQNEACFRTLLDNIPDSIALYDAQQRIKFVNAKGVQLLGRPLEEILGRTDEEIWPEYVTNSYLPLLHQAVETRTPQTQECTITLPNLAPINLIVSYIPLLDENGEIQEILGITYDITERKRVGEALRQSEQRFRVAQELSLDAFTILQSVRNQRGEIIDFEWTYVNPKAAEILQHPANLLVGQRLLQVLPGNKINSELFERYVRVVETGEPHDIELSYNCDGIAGWFRNMAVKLEDGVAVSFCDISDRKQTEAAWREGKQILDAIMEYIPEGITIADAPDVIIRSVSKYGEQLIGRSREVLEGIPATEHPKNWGLLHTDGITRPQPEELPLTRAVKQGEVVTDEEWVIERPNGEKINILCNAGPIRNQYGKTSGGIIAWRDITERKQAEETLRQALQRLNFHVDNTPMGVIEWDREFCVIRWSATAERILGWTAEEAVGKQLTELPFVFEEDAEPVAEVCKRLVVGEESQIFSYNRNYRKDGSVIHCEWYNSSLRDESGRMNSVLSLILDVTDRKLAEAERERLLQQEQAARAEAEQANRVKDEFLAVLSHELRTPLNPILGWSRLLQSKKLDPTKTTEALKTIERNAKLQVQLIEDLLDVSRILQGKINLNVISVDLVSIISSAMETVRLAAEAKSIKIQTMLQPNVGKVAGDSSRLQQVVWNLLSNAIKFTPSEGQVEIKLERLGSMAEITVNDTGKGISPQFLPYVFDSFRQADSTTTRKFGGLGLGLAIVRRLVELHGGTVQAQSLGEGLGATFQVRLPLMLNQSQTNQDGGQIEPALDLSGIKILVVDDDADSLNFVAFVLEQEGANVAIAGSATEALVALSQFQPDVLLSDIGMPQIDGYMLMQQVRNLPPEQGGNIPAIALTAYAGEINEKQAIAAGFQQHISKPVEPVDLVTVISSLIR
ncbi:MAG: PAS domain-containing protein, partial [Nostoc sp. C3-bin3]|nr:PAS domain-containing protein [Nostoc sp. C3-bin3]